ncbi:MAG: helix-hairpin-helix domain-containing protein, partial [Bacteroidota bacterium]
RDKRSKNSLVSALDGIPGIGEKTVKLLLNEYRSVSNIKKANPEDIQKLIGKKRSEALFDYFEKEKNG